MRLRLLAVLFVLLLSISATPAGAAGLLPGVDLDLGLDVPLLSSDNVRLVGAVPAAAAISTAFSSDSPHMYVNTLAGIHVYNIANPRLPLLVGYEPMAFFQNENINLGERPDGSKFLLVGFDLFGVTPNQDPTQPATFDELAVVDVTNPLNPRTVARVRTTTSTHTVSCANAACTHAYTAGHNNAFSIVDLTDYRNPTEIAVVDSAVGDLGHDWDVDAAGIAWHVGWEGLAAYDVSDPANPKVLNTSDEHGLNGSDWNNFILHNSVRPNAEQFGKRGKGRGTPRVLRDASGGPSLAHGNVLLVTEEDYIDVTCETEGSFQTWYVPELGPNVNPDGVPGAGTVTPLDQWNTELFDTGIKTVAGAFCSAHYFDYHQAGIVAQGFYQQGVRFLDVADPTNIKQIGYWVTGAQESWGAYWVPERDALGRVTGNKTNLVYTNDPTRGIEILQVDIPTTHPDDTPAVVAPVLDEWLQLDVTLPARASNNWGYACPLARL